LDKKDFPTAKNLSGRHPPSPGHDVIGNVIKNATQVCCGLSNWQSLNAYKLTQTCYSLVFDDATLFLTLRQLLQLLTSKPTLTVGKCGEKCQQNKHAITPGKFERNLQVIVPCLKTVA